MLETQRLILRPFQEADIEPFVVYRSDLEVARYQSWETPYTREQAAIFVQEMRQSQPGSPGTWYQFAIEKKEQPGLIGDCALYVLIGDTRQAEIGFTLSPQYQKQGFATEAVICLLEYAFGELQIHRVTATCDVENSASARLLERVGMRREAHFIQNIWFKGSWGSEFLYAILHREWSVRATFSR